MCNFASKVAMKMCVKCIKVAMKMCSIHGYSFEKVFKLLDYSLGKV